MLCPWTTHLNWWHNDIIKWKLFPRYWSFVRGIHRPPVNPPPPPPHTHTHKGQWCGALMFSLICAWTNGSVNNETPMIWDAIVLLMTLLLLILTVYPKKYAHGFCFAVLCCGYTLTDFPISIRLTSLALWQSNDCPSASKAILMNMDKYFSWIHYERLHNHIKAKHNKTVCVFLGIYCTPNRHLVPNRSNHEVHEVDGRCIHPCDCDDLACRPFWWVRC